MVKKRKEKEVEITVDDVRFEGDNAVILFTARIGDVTVPSHYAMPVDTFEKENAEKIVEEVKKIVSKRLVKAAEIRGTKVRLEV